MRDTSEFTPVGYTKYAWLKPVFYRSKLVRLLAMLVLAFTLSAQLDVSAKLVHKKDARIKGLPHSHVHMWYDDQVKPIGVVIAMHGLIMHGGVYDALARNLVDDGYLVIAADMRGYGRWSPDKVERLLSKADFKSDLSTRVHSPESNLNLNLEETQVLPDSDESPTFLKSHAKVRYSETYKDLLKMTRVVSSNYPDLPLFLVGESMGAGMALHVAGTAPECVDGLVLSSPAIKRKLNLVPRVVVDLCKFVRHPRSPVDISPYIRKFASEDPEIAELCVVDPMVRKHLSVGDLVRTSREINRNIKFAKSVPPDIPVLIIQGDKDRMVKSNGASLLLSHLRCKDQTMKWFEGRGHILLETPLITDETMSVVEEWINYQAQIRRKLASSR